MIMCVGIIISDEKQIPSLADQCLEIRKEEEERGMYSNT